jgi:hypothetical protein
MALHLHSSISLDIENLVALYNWIALADFGVVKSLDRGRIDRDLFLEMSWPKMNKGVLSM